MPTLGGRGEHEPPRLPENRFQEHAHDHFVVTPGVPNPMRMAGWRLPSLREKIAKPNSWHMVR